MAAQLSESQRGRPSRWMTAVCVGLIRGYQLGVSPWLGANCRYLPTCSIYAREAIALHGPGRGSWLALRRICRCHPWGGSGYDPVPGSTPPDHPK